VAPRGKSDILSSVIEPGNQSGGSSPTRRFAVVVPMLCRIRVTDQIGASRECYSTPKSVVELRPAPSIIDLVGKEFAL